MSSATAAMVDRENPRLPLRLMSTWVIDYSLKAYVICCTFTSGCAFTRNIDFVCAKIGFGARVRVMATVRVRVSCRYLSQSHIGDYHQ